MTEPSLIIETSETCICMNEACDGGHHTIRRDYTDRKIETRTGNLVVRALCDSCRTFYRVTRRPIDGNWSAPKIEVITDRNAIAAFEQRIQNIGAIQREPVPA